MRMPLLITLLILCFSANAQVLRIGIEPYDPPFSTQIDEKNHLFSGFEAELMTAICKQLNADCKFIPIQFEDLFTQISKKNIDLAIGQISITSERSQAYAFSLPYMVSNGQYITYHNTTIKTDNDIKGGKVGIFKGSLYKEYLLDTFEQNINILEYDSSPAAFQALISGNVDALLLADIAEQYWVANSDYPATAFQYIGDPIPLGDGYGIMGNLESNQLVTNVNAALKTLESNGTYLKIYDLYFSTMKPR